MNQLLLFAGAAVGVFTPRETLDKPFYVQFGRPGWDPFSRNDLEAIYPYGYQQRDAWTTADQSTLKVDLPYIAKGSALGEGVAKSPRQLGYLLDCESGFSYDACQNDAKQVCDAFCQNMCHKRCQNLDQRPLANAFGDDLESTVGKCLKENHLESCAYNYGTITKIGIRQICSRVFNQLRPVDTSVAKAIVQVQAVALNLNWTAFTSQNFKSIRRVILELRHRQPNPATSTTTKGPSTKTAPDTSAETTAPTPPPASDRIVFDPSLPEDTTNIVRLMRKIEFSSEGDGSTSCAKLNSQYMPVIASDLSTHHWQRFGTFGLPYYMDDEIYQVDLSYLFNSNVWNSLGTESTVLIWFNTVQGGFEFYQSEDSGAFVFSDFNRNKIFTKGKIRSANILSIVSQFNDRKSEF